MVRGWVDWVCGEGVMRGCIDKRGGVTPVDLLRGMS